ncbi:MAG TPA: CHASE3 domain-containing protein, partial [candidate division Zixibacteria bacterium]|nr:CHASE3 domain-containing protein [candidate division Zixibacteria bacterium]
MKLKIGGKILAGFCFVLAVLAITILVSDWKMGLIGDAVTEIATSYVPLNDKITNAEAAALTQESNLRGYLLDRQPEELNRYEEKGKELKQELDEAESMIASSKNLTSLGLLDALKKLEADYTTFDDSAQRLIQMAEKSNDNSEFKDFFERVLKNADNFDTEVENVLAKVSHGLDSVTVGAEHHEASAFQLIMTLGIVALVVGTLIGWIIARRISKPIQRVVELSNQMNAEFHDFVGVVDAVASNDLTHQVRQSEIVKIGKYSSDEVGSLVKAVEETISAKDQIAISLNKMTTNLKQMVRQLNDNATQLVSAASEISSSSEQMSKGAQQQAG